MGGTRAWRGHGTPNLHLRLTSSQSLKVPVIREHAIPLLTHCLAQDANFLEDLDRFPGLLGE
jgi:hypothetical protein